MADKTIKTEPTVAVVTLHNSPNYGSCLQTYATQTVLSRMGATPSIVDYYRHDAIPENETERALQCSWVCLQKGILEAPCGSLCSCKGSEHNLEWRGKVLEIHVVHTVVVLKHICKFFGIFPIWR